MRRRLIPDISNLHAFECAARHGNFTRAADELHLTQSAVSRQIRELEAQTGLVLFERLRQRVILSDAGHRFLPQVRRLLAQSEQLMIGAVAAGHMRKSLNVATLPTFGARWLMPRLGDFIGKFGDVALSIESRSKPFDFDEDHFDVAIHYGQPTWARATCTFLCNETVVPVASATFASRYSIITPHDIADAPLLHLTTRATLWSRWFENAGIATDSSYRGLRLDQFSMIIGAAISGLGIALLPSYLIEEELRSGALKPMLDLPMATENSYHCVLPERSRRSEISNHFQSWLLSQLESHPGE